MDEYLVRTAIIKSSPIFRYCSKLKLTCPCLLKKKCERNSDVKIERQKKLEHVSRDGFTLSSAGQVGKEGYPRRVDYL